MANPAIRKIHIPAISAMEKNKYKQNNKKAATNKWHAGHILTTHVMHNQQHRPILS
jgi:hypothetical protein